jgi:hypothetical protein
LKFGVVTMNILPSYHLSILKLGVWIPVVLLLSIGLIAVQPVYAKSDATDQSQTMMDMTYNFKFMLGLAGELQAEGQDEIGGAPSSENDLEPILGGGFEVDFPLHEYFLLGSIFSFHTWDTTVAWDLGIERDFLLDLSVVPKGRYVFKGSPFAVYLGLPIGFSLGLVKDENMESVFPLWSTDGLNVDVGLGMNLSVLAGAQMNLASYFGLMLELGYTFHYIWHDVEIDNRRNVLNGEIESDIQQLAINVGFYFM